MITGASAMVKCLEYENVDIVFGYPGATICPFYDELKKSDIRHILVRTEQCAAHAASGYSRTSGRVGVCVSTSGPGATNLITGIATAYMDSIPMIAITGQVSLNDLGKDVFQEADITGACQSFVKHSFLITKADEIPKAMKEAFFIAATGRPGPVLIDIPQDVQKQAIKDFRYPDSVDIPGYKPKTTGHSLQIKKALDLISKSERPLICCGGGVVSAGAREEMTAFATKSGIPIVSTMMGIGVMSMSSPVYLGMMGSYGRSYANRALDECDLLMLCGARVADRAVGDPKKITEHAKIIHIDIDPAEIGKNIHVDVPIVGDVKSILKKMSEDINPTDRSSWRSRVMEYKKSFIPLGNDRTDYVEPRSFIRNLSDMLDENAILLADPGQTGIWAAINFSQKEGRFLTSGGLGTMGYSVPAAIGAKLAKPARQVVVICGDGAFQMSMCELATISKNKLDIKIIIMDNGMLGMVREIQKEKYGSRYFGTELEGNPDFVRIAQAYNISGSRAENNEEALIKAKKMLETEGPYLLTCSVDPDTPTI
jgi:acetolactate synthase-1/2/3 large subunit